MRLIFKDQICANPFFRPVFVSRLALRYMELPLFTVLERLRHVDIAVLAKLCAEVRITCSAFNPKQNATVEL